MKKTISLLLIAALIACAFCGCGTETAPKKLTVVATVFPEYDWVREVLGDRADDCELTLLLDNGVDLHSYQPTADDIMKISNCDLFIYVGGESDAWVSDALAQSGRSEDGTLSLIAALGDSAKLETPLGDTHEEKAEYDEHVWLSLRNARLLTSAIAEKLSEIDPENADEYKKNAAAYAERLSALDEKYKAAVDNSSGKTVLFGDRFPFRYLADDYGLTYYAAFAGCSAESEASFETIAFLADKVDSLGLPAVLTLEGTKHNIAETVISSTKAKSARVLTMDSMQAAVAPNATYLSIMEKNLEALIEAIE